MAGLTKPKDTASYLASRLASACAFLADKIDATALDSCAVNSNLANSVSYLHSEIQAQRHQRPMATM